MSHTAGSKGVVLPSVQVHVIRTLNSDANYIGGVCRLTTFTRLCLIIHYFVSSPPLLCFQDENCISELHRFALMAEFSAIYRYMHYAIACIYTCTDLDGSCEKLASRFMISI